MNILNKWMDSTGLIFLATFLLSFITASAFELTPLSVTINSEGRDSSAFIKLQNKHEQAKAIQVTMVTREPDIFDKELKNQDAEDEFLVYPPQFILKAHSSKLCKISWVGDPLTKREKSYRFIVDELDVDLNPGVEKKSGIRILMRYEGALYVRPRNAEEAEVLLDEYKTFTDEENNEMLSIVLENNGGIHRLLLDTQLILSAENIEKITLSSNDLKGLEGSNILAGRKREYCISLPDVLKGKEIQAEFYVSEE